ncbi:MAG: efflux RND transporter periplasmic adaptor subunit [Acidobacteria bacterium]|nr:efflux RND transporter periplasmic adaptor subunit [Acidobacteriota bacterium]
MKNLGSKLVFGMVVLALGWAIWWGTRPTPIKVEVSQVTRGSLTVTVDAEGKTRVRDRFVIGSPVGGRLLRIGLRRGDQVTQQQVVANIDPLPLSPLDPRETAQATSRVVAAEALVREAAANQAHVTAEVEQARRELARAEKLATTGDVAPQEVERLRLGVETASKAVEAAAFRVKAAEAEVNVAKAALLALKPTREIKAGLPIEVRSPVAGKVLRVIEESERIVTAGTPLVEISNPSNLEIVIDVLSTDAVRILPGTPVTISGWGNETRLKAQVRLIEPSAFTKISALGVEEQRVNVIADFQEPQSQLGDGYRVEASIVIWENSNVAKVPASALFRVGTNWAVFVVEDGKVIRRQIEIGHRNTFEAEALNGLLPGTFVVLHPSNQLQDGTLVEVANKQ